MLMWIWNAEWEHSLKEVIKSENSDLNDLTL